MAGNKFSSKTKGKVKISNLPNEDVEESVDFAMLRKPIMTSITGFAQARKIYDCATEELKELLSKECDLIYECKVCRNMFRSLANFISHKRVYCKEKFKNTVHGHFGHTYSMSNELTQIKQMEAAYQASKLEPANINYKDKTDTRIPMTKDLTAIIEYISQTRGAPDKTGIDQMSIQNIPGTSVAVFQNKDMEIDKMDCMRSQILELNSLLSKDKAVLQSDGKFSVESSNDTDSTTSDGVIHISDDESDNNGTFMCGICSLKFSTKKTLKFHEKYKHSDNRLVYPCPDCVDIFSSTWSVYRHLFRVHRKTAAQVRRLRDSIQTKAFNMDNPPASYEKRKKTVAMPKITEEERLDQENQAWMENMESDGSAPRCGGCGRSFERRAALIAHTHTCQARTAALARNPHRDTRRIEIQIRKDYHKGPSNTLIPSSVVATQPEVPDNKVTPDEDSQSSFKTEKEQSENQDVESEPIDQDEQSSNDKDSTSTESPEKDKLEDKPQVEKPPVSRPILMFNDQAEKTRSNFIMFKQKVTQKQELDKETLTCKKCEESFTLITKLYDHMAAHYKWLRFACKLCNFKHYYYDHISEHVKTVHKLKGDSDFYYSTVKAIDGNEALQLSLLKDEANRASSDSSRISDDSNTSARVEGSSRKRKSKMPQSILKKMKEVCITAKEESDSKDSDEPIEKIINYIIGNKENTTNSKTFEENSSDLDDVDFKISKKTNDNTVEISPPVAISRRPVRKRPKPKNDDFEYDLSNLLKMEAQGYRDSLQSNIKSQPSVATNKPVQNTNTTNVKSSQSKKKQLPDSTDFIGALMAMSRKSVLLSSAHLKRHNIYNIGRENKSNVFARPTIPKNKSEKNSPTKESNTEDISKVFKQSAATTSTPIVNSVQVDLKKLEKAELLKSREKNSLLIKSRKSLDSNRTEKDNTNVSPMVPIKFRRQSLDVLNKSGIKTKILVIKPINRNSSGMQPSKNQQLKFPTIKLKNPTKSTNEENSSDQAMVVKEPSVDSESVNITDVKVEQEPIEYSDKVNGTDNPPIENKDCNNVITDNPAIKNKDCNNVIEEVSVPEIIESSSTNVIEYSETKESDTTLVIKSEECAVALP